MLQQQATFRRAAALALVLAATALSREASAAAPPRLLVQDIVPKGVAPGVARSLTDLLELELSRGDRFEVVSQQDLRTLLQVEEQRILAGVVEGREERMADFARKVDAPFALACSVGKVGSAYVLSLRLLDVESLEVVRRINQTLVGEAEGLIGSLRAAVIALQLEEQGVAPDISAQLVDELKIGEKAKRLFLTLSPEYEAPVGGYTSADDLLVLRPDLYGLRLSAALPVLRWLRVFVSAGLSTSLDARQESSESNIGLVYRAEADRPMDYLMQGSGTTVDYDVLRIPLELGIELTPASGRFLPFVRVGVGAAWQRYSFSSATMTLFREPDEEDRCHGAFEPTAVGADGLGACVLDAIPMEPEGDQTALSLDGSLTMGVEWLLTHHLGLRLFGRYHVSWLPEAEDDLRVAFEAEKGYDAGTPDDPAGRRDEYGKLMAIPKTRHGLAFGAGGVMYW